MLGGEGRGGDQETGRLGVGLGTAGTDEMRDNCGAVETMAWCTYQTLFV